MFKNRSNQNEILDDLNLSGQELYQNLEDIERINRFLGGHNVLINALKKINIKKQITILDVGCGSGDSLRLLEKNNQSNTYIGIDANKNIIEFAKTKLNEKSKITFKVSDCFENEIYKKIKPDVVICSLFLHHFSDDDIIKLINIMKLHSSVIIINDLHRNSIGYYGFKLIAALFNTSPITKHDGLISILRGFKKHEWKQILNKIDDISCQIKWKWAFRHQIIITCNT